MRIVPATLPEVLLLQPEIHRDRRGFFYESHNEQVFAKEVADVRFVQDNCSRSLKNVLRGLHYQIEEAQGKLVRVSAGEIFDVAVDLRRTSPTFARWAAHTLSAESQQSIWIPPGYAHGFLVLSDFADVQYKTTTYWAPAFERCIVWNDPDLAIAWPLSAAPLVSDRDARGALMKDAELYP